MSLTIGQANAVNTLLDYIAIKNPRTGARPTAGQLLDAMRTLVPAAHKALGAGWSSTDLEERFRLMAAADEAMPGGAPVGDATRPSEHSDE